MNSNIEFSNNLKIYGKKIKNKLYDSSSDDWRKINYLFRFLKNML